MNALVIYYSRSGNTRKAGEAVAQALAADTEELLETKDRSGLSGYLRAGGDAMLKREAAIKQLGKSVDAYDLVVVGTPIWAFTVAPPVRALLSRQGSRMARVAFFCTMGGSGAKRAFREMADLCGKQPVATLALTEKELARGIAPQVEAFTTRLAFR